MNFTVLHEFVVTVHVSVGSFGNTSPSSIKQGMHRMTSVSFLLFPHQTESSFREAFLFLFFRFLGYQTVLP